MKLKALSIISILTFTMILLSFRQEGQSAYTTQYLKGFSQFEQSLTDLVRVSRSEDASEEQIRIKLRDARMKMKQIDPWLRYLAPITYKKINSPLPVEWETEVFEKYETPYRREGAGLMLAESHLDEGGDMEGFIDLIQSALDGLETYTSDSVLPVVSDRHHFLLSNRLFLLNLAAIYTNGFECPDPEKIIPELMTMLDFTKSMNEAYNQTWPAYRLSDDYSSGFENMIDFVNRQSTDFEFFDHFTFIRDHVNPLFSINQQMIKEYKVVSSSFNDYSLNNDARSIFDKSLYDGQHAAGLFASVTDEAVIARIKSVGRMLFFDPILSGNNRRSCASCHKPDKFLGDGLKYNLHFDETDVLTRNTPTLVNVIYNHLLHLDGKQISTQSQAIGVMTNPDEMGSKKEDIVEKVLSCKEYKREFSDLLKYSRGSKDISISHIVSAITLFYSDFSLSYSPFDDAMNKKAEADEAVKRGFNLFMSKAQCGTCHFAPQFNGVKPPYVGSEFEVIGVPIDTSFSALSPDSGRYAILPEPEMVHAFRTGSLRNAEHTGPYMHNGVFETLEEVVEFYNDGGGAGRGLNVPNQTLPPDQLNLTDRDKEDLIAFMKSLSEDIEMPEPPISLPTSSKSSLKQRIVGGEY